MDFEFSDVDSIDKVPEQFRPIYGQQPNAEGKFSVAEAFKGIAVAINGFNKSNKQLRTDLKNGKVDLSGFAEWGDNPETILTGVKAAIEAAGQSKSESVNKAVEQAKAGMQAGFAKDLEGRDKRIEGLKGQLYGMMVENAATAAVVDAKGVPELLLPFIKQNVKVVEEDGQFKVAVVDAAGETRYGTTGSPMTIKELVTEMKAQEKYGRLFESEAKPGGGFKPGGAGQRPQAPAKDQSANGKIASGLAKRFGR